MFKDCTNLTKASKLAATSLETGCYQSMFEGCTSLKESPVLSDTYGDLVWTSSCYEGMFRGCKSLTSIICFAPNPFGLYAQDWVQGVSETGSFIKKKDHYWPKGNDGIPEGWNVIEI